MKGRHIFCVGGFTESRERFQRESASAVKRFGFTLWEGINKKDEHHGKHWPGSESDL